MLVVAPALVGGTGCITASIVDASRHRSDVRDRERERRQRIVALSPRAEAGDLAAMTSLAQALMSAEDRTRNDVPRAQALLSRAAEGGDGLAQAMLGDMFAVGVVQFATSYLPSSGQRDPRGIVLLQKAAAQACRFKLPGGSKEHRILLEPADRLANIFFTDDLAEQERLWRARSILHCGQPVPFTLSYRVNGAHTAVEKQGRFAMLLLTKSSADIERARTMAKLTPEDVAAAERQAEELRRLVAESERQYPAPSRKEVQ
jgi:TPR repeat protein